MGPSKKKTTTKPPGKASQAQRQSQGQPQGQRSQNSKKPLVASFKCFFCESEKPLEEQVPGRKLPICTNCHKHYTDVVSERPAQPTAAVSSSPLLPPTSPSSSSPPPPSSTPLVLHQSPVRPAVVIGTSKVLLLKKKKTKITITTLKPLEKEQQQQQQHQHQKPETIVDQSQGPKKKLKLRLTAPKRRPTQPFLFLSLPCRGKIPLSFPNPLRRKKEKEGLSE